ncbi:hypothetical protein [Chryseobacterium sp. ERMR1:04]|uniref:hypothetical protein n=1 Tax=Chryseobacterium sp. ERMR1:04 TaxID=1705393 RepID=UPI0006C890EB|nr:hypothetical protein [Chryseobacterium sp. ERMR1:04]KPH14105.1 hypothetical protein AMQ68_00840 [Chryseobacterium sp. ERMR1:04]
MEIGSIVDESNDDFSELKSFPITSAHMQQIVDLGIDAAPEKLELNFSHSCDNGDNPGPGQVIDPEDVTSCTGTARNGQKYFSDWRPKTVDWNISMGSPLQLSIYKIGACRCNIYGAIRYKYPTYTDHTRKYGGLRLRKMEDVNENNISNVYEYAYGKYENGTFIPDFRLNQPYNFSSFIKRYVRQFTGDVGGGSGAGTGNGEQVQIGSTFERYYRIHNSSQANNSYGSSDIMTYPSVVEITGKGKIIREFEEYTSSNYVYNKWKAGNLKREIYLNQNNDTLRVVNNTYKLNTLKNSLSEFTTSLPEVVAFSTDFDIIKVMETILQTPVDTYFVEHRMDLIESAKVEKDKSETTEYFNGKKITSKTKYEYYDTDINKPINLKNTKSVFPSGEIQQTDYSYAHEKGNQLMINKNMIGIPLETISTQTIGVTTQTLAKTETVYPKTVAEIINNDARLVLPLSIKSYDLSHIDNNPSTEVTHDQYDSKGNLQQYTTKDGIPVSIVWGYNNTQPIAKIEGAAYAQVSSLISGIVTASDTDGQLGTEASEQALITALNSFRNNTALSLYQTSTYTYDPLIGVKSITSPSGIREVYIYDTANRLKEIKQEMKNTNGSLEYKILKEFNYNYKN